MFLFFLLPALVCKVLASPVNNLNARDVQNDEGYINSLSFARPRSSRNGETALDVDEFSVEEGDLLTSTDRNAASSLWPDIGGQMIVPYEIDAKLKSRTDDILQALNMVSEKTCIRFQKRKKENDYLSFLLGPGCASFVGCQGGEQSLYVGPHCNVGNICHEVIHSVGLFHEHSRPDRDKYITIVYKNIASGKEENFQEKNGNTLGLSYDPESIMHYGNAYFSRNGQPTILAKDAPIEIGQRTHLSSLDVQKLRKLYRCDKRDSKENKKGSS